jgi:ribosome-associated translation inhibitor RaiA
MRLDVFSNDFNVSPGLRRYAEARVWPAADRVGARWVGVRFTGLHEGDGGPPRVACQVDVWLRRLGLVTVRHTDADPYAAIDSVANRLRHAIARKIATAAPMPLRAERTSCPDRFAEAVWENEGGRLKGAGRPANGPSKQKTTRRHRHVEPEHSRDLARHATAGQGTAARNADNRFPGFRPHPARLAHA